MRRTLAQKSAAPRGSGVQGKGAAVKPNRTGEGVSEKLDTVLALTEAIQGDFCDIPATGMLRSTSDRTVVPVRRLGQGNH